MAAVQRRDEEEYINAAQACALLQIKPATLYAYVSRGLLQSYKQGIRRQRFYRRSEVEALLVVRPDTGVTSLPTIAEALPPAEHWVSET